MAKYDALRRWLVTAPHPTVLSFDELSRLVGGLPRSAFMHRAWWANGRSHVQAVAWLDAGREVAEVNLSAGWVRFR